MNSQNPKISVIMAVYNGANHVRGAVKSILEQTERDFEFIIINDGSRDETSAILDAMAREDARLRIIHQENTGLTVALNRALALASGTYIARQDGDDISYPARFEKQCALLDQNPETVLVGANADDVYEDGSSGVWGFYTPEELQKITFLKTPFPHSTAMIRAETLRALGGYDESYKTAQDMELWMRMAKAGGLTMVEEPLIRRSIVSNSISVKRRWRQFYDALRARMKHNPWPRKPFALYHSIRSLLIGLILHHIVKR